MKSKITWKEWKQLSERQRRELFRVPVTKKNRSFLPTPDESIEHTQRIAAMEEEGKCLREEMNY